MTRQPLIATALADTLATRPAAERVSGLLTLGTV